MVALPKGPASPGGATYADIESAPPNVTAEIIAGSLVLSPRPANPHANAFAAALSDLRGAFGRRRAGEGPGGWVILGEPELHVDGILPDVFVPALAGWRRERFPEAFEGHKFELHPDWVCEILSRSTRSRDHVLKAPLYARAGVAWLWFVDPIERLVEVFANAAGRWIDVSRHEGDAVARIQPFDAVELDLSEWWLPLSE